MKLVKLALPITLLLTIAWAPLPQMEDGQDSSAIAVTQLHIFVIRNEDSLGIGEYYMLSNTGEHTYEGMEDPQTGKRVTVRFTLPEGADGLHFDGPGLGERFVEIEGGFADTEPILPGRATVEVFFAYALPYHEGVQVERVFELPVDSIVLVIAEEEGLVLAGDGVISAGMLDTQMGPALSYAAGPLKAGEPLVFSVFADSQPSPVAPGASASTRNTAREAAVGLAALSVALAVVYLLRRSPAPDPCPAEVRPIVKEIAALDVDFEAGRVEERDYRQERDALRRRVKKVLGE